MMCLYLCNVKTSSQFWLQVSSILLSSTVISRYETNGPEKEVIKLMEGVKRAAPIKNISIQLLNLSPLMNIKRETPRVRRWLTDS